MLVRQVVIVGAGIGGLTAAIALHQRGVAVTVLEQAEALGDAGAGLTLWPNALHALDGLGLSADLLARGRPIERASVRTANGDALQRTEPGAMAERYGFAPLAIHRAALHEVLLSALPQGVVRLGQAVTRYEKMESGVVVSTGGEQFHGELLIGADGINSTIRQQMRPDIELRYAGYPAWRGVAPASAAPDLDESVEVWGVGERFGMVPLADDLIYWYATATLPEGRTRSPAEHRADLRTRFESWYDPIPALIAATPNDHLLYHDVHDIPPFRGWSAGRVTLLGDAVHPTTPNLGQGACMAVESGIVLARALAEGTSLEQALQHYEAERYPRTSWVTEQSWLLGQVAQVTQPLACRLRNAILRVAPSWLMERQLDRVVGHKL